MFLACSAINMATEIAKVYVDDIFIASLEVPLLGRVCAISAHLAQKPILDYTEAMLNKKKVKWKMLQSKQLV
jgi:hypothetical protein